MSEARLEALPPIPPPPAPKPAPPPAAAARQAFDPRHKSPILASLLSVMPGLGQIYVGYYQRGFIHALIVASLISILAADVLDELAPLVGLFLAFFWLHNIIDAGRRAAFFNRAVLEGESYAPIRLPSDRVAPGPRGSLIGGTILVVVGFLLLLNTRFDVSLDWIEDWWPVGPMLLGVYLIRAAIRDRRELASQV